MNYYVTQAESEVAFEKRGATTKVASAWSMTRTVKYSNIPGLVASIKSG